MENVIPDRITSEEQVEKSVVNGMERAITLGFLQEGLPVGMERFNNFIQGIRTLIFIILQQLSIINGGK